MAKGKEAGLGNGLEGSLEFSWKTAQVRVWTERKGYTTPGERGCQETQERHLLPGNKWLQILFYIPS